MQRRLHALVNRTLCLQPKPLLLCLISCAAIEGQHPAHPAVALTRCHAVRVWARTTQPRLNHPSALQQCLHDQLGRGQSTVRATIGFTSWLQCCGIGLPGLPFTNRGIVFLAVDCGAPWKYHPPMNPRIKLRCTLIEAFDQCCRKQDKGTPAPSVTLHCTQALPRCRVGHTPQRLGSPQQFD